MTLTQVFRPLFAILISFISLSISAQSYRVTGQVSDAKTGETLIGVSIFPESKPFYGTNVTAVCQYDPGLVAGITEYWDDQTVTHFFFIPGIYSPDDWYPEHKNRLKLKDVDPIVLSESLAVLKLIESKIQ